LKAKVRVRCKHSLTYCSRSATCARLRGTETTIARHPRRCGAGSSPSWIGSTPQGRTSKARPASRLRCCQPVCVPADTSHPRQSRRSIGACEAAGGTRLLWDLAAAAAGVGLPECLQPNKLGGPRTPPQPTRCYVRDPSESLFIQPRRRLILRTSPVRISRKISCGRYRPGVFLLHERGTENA
jgi:hypothetical protein